METQKGTQKHGKVKVKKSTIWQTASFVLGALLLISILTDGFSFGPSVGSLIDDVNTLLTKEKSESVKTTLQSVRDELTGLEASMEPEETPEPEITGNTAVKLDFYVMSQCPFGTQVVDAIQPVVEQLGDLLDFSMYFIANDNGDGTFRSLHGEPEVKGDIVQLCAAKHNPKKYLDMIVCQNKNAGQIPDNWEQCAQDAGLDVGNIRSCYEGEEGKGLLSDSIKETNKVGATGSPTIYLNGASYTGGRQTTQFLQAICNELSEKPEPCLNLPEAVKVNLIILNDKRCAECDVSSLTGQLKSLFPGLQIESHDYGDAKGKQLFEETGVKLLPALLFDETVEDGEGYTNVQRYLAPAGKYQSLRIGAAFDPTAEICDNEKDDTGNGLIDCQDPSCQATLECREETPQKLDLFVMSQCPFGTQALDSMKEVLDNFGDEIDFNVHYIANDNGDGTFRSLHGQPEVDENIRELCAMNYYPDDYKYMEYVWCRNKDIQSTNWEQCAQEAGMSVTMLKNCFEGEEGKELLRKSIKLTNELGIGASPTWLANNRVQFSGVDAETVRKNYCASNPDLEGCENTLSTTATPAGNC
jgi:predicted DsbA family dithiol-disulfide isomerase